MPVILVNKVVGPEKNNQKKWRAEEEEGHKGLLTPPPSKKGTKETGNAFLFFGL
jgi:hypothetical protein